jgi:hypothetical protein
LRPSYLILGLLVVLATVGIYMSSDPQQAGNLSEMYRSVTLTGETREYVILALVVGIGGFIGYLVMTRR